MLAFVLLALWSAADPGAELVEAQAQVLEPAPLAPGASGELSIVLLEQPERDLPLALRLAAPEVELADNRLGWSAVVDPLALQPRLRARFRAPEQPGRYTVEATLSYSVCTPSWCRTKQSALSLEISVAAPDPAPGA